MAYMPAARGGGWWWVAERPAARGLFVAAVEGAAVLCVVSAGRGGWQKGQTCS